MEEQQEQPKKPESVIQAEAAAEALRKENERMEKNIAELKEREAFIKLGGDSQGAPQEEKPKELTPKEYKDAVLSGQIKPE